MCVMHDAWCVICMRDAWCVCVMCDVWCVMHDAYVWCVCDAWWVMHDAYDWGCVKNFLAHHLLDSRLPPFLCSSVPLSFISALCQIHSNKMSSCNKLFCLLLKPFPISHTNLWWITLLRSISTLHITHLPSLGQTGYISYSLGIQNASRMSLV